MIIYLTQHQVTSQLHSFRFSSCFEQFVSAVSGAIYNVFVKPRLDFMLIGMENFDCCIVKFVFKLLQGDPQSHDPVVFDNGVTYLFIQHSNIFLMTATRQNCNAASLLFFLHRTVDVSVLFLITVLN